MYVYKVYGINKVLSIITTKKLITYICGFDPCREQHQVVTNSLTKFIHLSLRKNNNVHMWF